METTIKVMPATSTISGDGKSSVAPGGGLNPGTPAIRMSSKQSSGTTSEGLRRPSRTSEGLRRPSLRDSVRTTSLDVPSLAQLSVAHLNRLSVEGTAEAADESVTPVKTTSYRQRFKHQDTFGVENARSLDDDEITSDLDVALSFAGPILMICLLYVAALFIFEVKYFIPYDGGFAIVLLWSGSMIGGQLALLVGLPPLLGMLCSGILLKNLGDPVRGLPDEWGAAIRAFGLMNILMRGGLEMDLKAVQRLGPAAVRLTVLPGVTEALCVAGTASLIFGMPFPLALALGFILGAVSPAVVVGGMFDLQSRGYGIKKGVPSLVVAAASFDDVVAISGFSMCIGLAVGTGNVLVEALHGPINIIAGIGFGIAGACLAALTKIWNKSWKRSAVVLLLGVVFTFASKYAHYSGAGALASLVMAATASQFWQRGWPAKLSHGPDDHYPHEVEMDLAKVWRTAAEPLLFSVIGSALDFGNIDAGTIPKGLGVLLCGVTMRTTFAYIATCNAGLCFRERLFIALAWMPKATVQAALGSVPLDLIRREKKDESDFGDYEQWGMDILTTAVFSILVTAPCGLIVIQQLGPRWLEYGYPETEGEEGELVEESDTQEQQDQSKVAAVSEGDAGAGTVKKIIPKGTPKATSAGAGTNFGAVMPGVNDLCLVEVDATGEPDTPVSPLGGAKQGWPDK